MTNANSADCVSYAVALYSATNSAPLDEHDTSYLADSANILNFSSVPSVIVVDLY